MPFSEGLVDRTYSSQAILGSDTRFSTTAQFAAPRRKKEFVDGLKRGTPSGEATLPSTFGGAGSTKAALPRAASSSADANVDSLEDSLERPRYGSLRRS